MSRIGGEENIRAASKSLFVNDKKNRGKETQDNDKRGQVDITKFAKPNVKLSFVKEESKAYDLSDWEVQYARWCEERLVEGVTGRQCCGNSPFCSKESHQHDEDSTAFGQLENKVRTSLWMRRRKVEHLQTRPLLPLYVKNLQEDVAIEKQNLFVSEHKKQMSDAEFIRGVKSGELSYLVLAQWRVYYSEYANITLTLSNEQREIELTRQRQQEEASHSTTNARELTSINDYAAQRQMSLASVATNRLRIINIRASNELKNLLQRHGVRRLSLAQHSLFQMMLRNHRQNESESKKLELIRSELEKYTNDEEQPRGRFFSENDTMPEPTATQHPPSPRKDDAVNKTMLIDLVGHDDPDADVDDKPPSRERGKKRTWSEFVHHEQRSPLECYRAVCKSQYSYNSEDCNACTSICLNVAGGLAQTAIDHTSWGVTELDYINRCINWAEMVKSGIDAYRNRENKSVSFEHVMELLKRGVRAEAVKANFDFVEHTGSMFQEKFIPKTDEEALEQSMNPDLETALELCEQFAAGRLPYSCMITFHSHTIAASSHRHGWHIFDSLGTIVAGKSVLFSVETRADAIRVIRHLFNVESLQKLYEARDKTASVQLDYEVSYSLFCMVLKK